MNANIHSQLLGLRELAKAWLETGHAGRGFLPDLGICSQPALTIDGAALLFDLNAQWPGGSGSKEYPVPRIGYEPGYAYNYTTAQEKWNPKHEYARYRWALLDWLIEQTAPGQA